MKLGTLLTLLALWFVSPPSLVHADAPPQQETIKNSLLWGVEGPNGYTYLLGTIHLGITAQEALDPIAWDKFYKSSTFAMEVDPLAMGHEQIFTAAQLPKNQTLDAILGSQKWEKLTHLIGVDFPKEALRRLRPWFVISLVISKLIPSKDDLAMDRALFDIAQKEGKKLEFLEGGLEQVGFLDQALTFNDLSEVINDPDQVAKEQVAMGEAYRARDLQALAKTIFKEKKRKRRQFEILFYRRSKNWMPQIERYIQQGGVFIAVGVGHLLEDKGLITLLQNKGYKISRVTQPTDIPGGP